MWPNKLRQPEKLAAVPQILMNRIFALLTVLLSYRPHLLTQASVALSQTTSVPYVLLLNWPMSSWRLCCVVLFRFSHVH